ncbi:tyrosine-type recombinase/integrase [Salmonella enterica subsp. enterica serovar Montevideo]|uniref:phage integrase n=1 Tax=Salmonella enterica TaxID=28901 RepID=UPI00107A8410|nr:tyrosine-type recombinase/integrase [Salmonella enterica]ECD8163095.1 tyrosine-type recombinase/integrase [Salmonella enterica subsp. enterica serovar Takoradi]EDA8441431.1 tyrosine-type recombinase/integrase [Salmonella enterica subsp. enterica serovar Bakau]EDR0165098.1 tyrosine-type recombinase/integrase [Salmonella enterica subsp. enterica serovar Ohio]EKR1648701.1 tyrosine-type recombinase/integrase [Salmonella enterica subsp. enterica serovar Newport]EAB4404384.1 integrase [Salmonella
MSIVRKNGKWLLDFYPEGKPQGKASKRIRKTFSTKGEAIAYQTYIMENVHVKPWLDGKEDRRKLLDLVNQWFDEHGITLDDGEKRKSAMVFACESMGDPLAHEFDASLFSQYRKKRLSGEISRTTRVKQVSPRTMNLELAYFRAVFNELKRLGHWKVDNPLTNVRPFKSEEAELAYLGHEEITRLLAECLNSRNDSVYWVACLCLLTGARWDEAESLTTKQIKNLKVSFFKTKGNRNRTVPISQDFFEALPKPEKPGRYFKSCYSAFRKAVERAELNLPDGQLSHVLRHTFASHFMMNGGNILVLKDILGHTDIKMTMRYAHFSPNHLEDAVRLNPLGTKNEFKN